MRLVLPEATAFAATLSSEIRAAGASGIDPLVQDIGVCLLVAGVLSVIFERARIPTIAALLVAGVAIGPLGLSVVDDKARIETIAHLGLTLLLFVIGLEVNLRSLLASGRLILLTGLLQVPLTVGCAWLLFRGAGAAGAPGLEGSYAPLYLGLAAGFSSTLLVVKQLQTRLKLDSFSGRLAIAMLIFQDVWAIVILALQPNFERPDVKPLAATFGGIALVALVAVIFAKRVLPSAFRYVAKVPELVVSLALAWCFGLGLFGAHLGTVLGRIGIHVSVSVSLEMCALIAGACVASLPYSHEVVAKVINLRDFFVTLFFVALGMGIPMPKSADVLVGAILLSAVAILLRFVVFVPVLYVSGGDRRLALTTSTRLAQVSEFCLVILYLGQSLGHITADLTSSVIFAFVLTALLTPSLFDLADEMEDRVGALFGFVGLKAPPTERQSMLHEENHPRIVLLGLHRLASSLLYDLEHQHPDLFRHTLVVDFNVATHAAVRARGARAMYGDFSNPETLKHAHVDGAELIVSTVPDDMLKGTTNLALARELRRLAPKAKIMVNAVQTVDAAAMYEAGADYVFSWRTETARGVLPAIEATLNGGLADYRQELRTSGHDLGERREVLD